MEGKVVLRRSAAQRSQDLGYSTAEVISCLTQLNESQYHETVEYDHGVYDVYLATFISPSGHRDQVYVKFKIPPVAVVPQVIVLSFHV